MPSAGKQVLLYLVDGVANGLRTGEIANWTGHLVAAPRSDLSRVLEREESHRTGVYVLLGEGDEAVTKVYIGEGDEVATRLKQHQGAKAWWDRLVVISSQAQAQQLTKSQVRFLESELITLAKAAARATLANGTDPGFAKLSEAETANMRYFLEQLLVLLPAIGVDEFSVPAASKADAATTSPDFLLIQANRGVDARARMIDGQFVVLEKSLGSADVAQSPSYSSATQKVYQGLQVRRNLLAATGAIAVDEAGLRVLKDIPFSSPSTAGSILLGRSCNGRTSWVTELGKTFGEWESGGD